MEPTQQDTQAVIERTDQWLACVSDGQANRLEDILTDDFRYSAAPRFGATELDKAQLIETTASLRGTSHKLHQNVQPLGPLLISLTITRPDVKPEGVETVPTRPIHNKKLAFLTSWRKEEGRWRCFDNHLLDELPAAE